VICLILNQYLAVSQIQHKICSQFLWSTNRKSDEINWNLLFVIIFWRSSFRSTVSEIQHISHVRLIAMIISCVSYCSVVVFKLLFKVICGHLSS